MRLIASCVILLTCISALNAGELKSSPLDLTIGVGVKVLYSWSRQRCDDEDVPDVPARAFRDYRGEVKIVATNSENHIRKLQGEPLQLRAECKVSLTSAHDGNASQYNDYRFLAATWTEDGHTIFGIVHNEYHANEHVACKFHTITPCWYNSLTYAISKDGGLTFTQALPPNVIAAAPFRQDFDQGRHRGFFNPTNILQWNGYWWFLSPTTGWAGQPGGTCLFRSQQIDDASSWRLWNGSGFTVRLEDPYLEAITSARCQIVVPYAFTGIYKKERSDLFIGLLTDQDKSDGDPQKRTMNIEISYSSDLISWTKPDLLKTVPAFNSRSCDDKERFAYPAFLDLHSSDRNFSTVNQKFLLLLTRAEVDQCHITNNRDLIAYEVDVENRSVKDLVDTPTLRH